MNNNKNNYETIIYNINKDPYNYSKKLSIDELVDILNYVNNKYYNTNNEIITDEIYDILENILKNRDPKNIFFKNVGHNIDENKVKLPFWLGSINKIKSDTKKLEKWLLKYNQPYNISDKLDGTSALFCYFEFNEKWIMRLYTRGNGIYGKNISHLIK